MVWQRVQNMLRTEVRPCRSFTSNVAFSNETVINVIMRKQTYLHLPNILGLLMLECYLETKAFSPFLSLKLNQTSDDPIIFAHTHPS